MRGDAYTIYNDQTRTVISIFDCYLQGSSRLRRCRDRKVRRITLRPELQHVFIPSLTSPDAQVVLINLSFLASQGSLPAEPFIQHASQAFKHWTSTTLTLHRVCRALREFVQGCAVRG